MAGTNQPLTELFAEEEELRQEAAARERNKRALKPTEPWRIEALNKIWRHIESFKNRQNNQQDTGQQDTGRVKKRRVLKRQSTRGKKASRVKSKRQNASKKKKSVKTRYT